MEIRTLLVDSNAALLTELKNLLRLYKVFKITGELSTTEEAAEYLLANDADVVFINQQPAPPERTSSGCYLAALLASARPDVQVALYSDDDSAALSAWRCTCSGFLKLPFDPLALQALAARLQYVYELQLTRREAVNRSVMIKTRSGYQLMNLNDILFIERSDRKNRIVTESGREIVLQGYTLGDIESLLAGSGFFRCYQSFIVNLSKVSFIRANSDSKSYAIRFAGYSGEILLSREKYPELVELLRERYVKLSI